MYKETLTYAPELLWPLLALFIFVFTFLATLVGVWRRGKGHERDVHLTQLPLVNDSACTSREHSDA